jgi:hypothetical protein
MNEYMVTTPKPNKTRPWERHRGEKGWQLLEPGYGGMLTDEELEFILTKLRVDPALAYWWGFRGATKRRPLEAIKAVAMWGSPDVRSENVKLVRPHQHPVASQMVFPWG